MKSRSTCPLCFSDSKKSIYFTEGMELVQCTNCELIYLKDIPSEEVLYEDYHEWTGFVLDDYSKSGKDDSLRALWNINNQRIKRIKEFRNQGDLLDVGCGSGAFLLTAKEHGFLPEGIDVSEKAIRFVKKELELKASKSSINELERCYDVITLWHVLEHFLDPQIQLKEIHSKLNEHGFLFGEVPNWNSAKFQLSGKKWEGGNHPLYHRSFFTPKTLKMMLEKAGFSKVKILHLPYTSSGKKDTYYFLKKGFNLINRDAFLTFVAWK